MLDVLSNVARGQLPHEAAVGFDHDAMLVEMAAWCRGDGAPPYPLADGCQDHLVALAIEESAASGAPVATSVEAWAATH